MSDYKLDWINSDLTPFEGVIKKTQHQNADPTKEKEHITKSVPGHNSCSFKLRLATNG